MNRQFSLWYKALVLQLYIDTSSGTELLALNNFAKFNETENMHGLKLISSGPVFIQVLTEQFVTLFCSLA